jgi:hypothetical protein
MNIATDNYFKTQLLDCLDYITYFVDEGLDTTTVWNTVLVSRKQLSSGVFILDEESIPPLLQLTRDQRTEKNRYEQHESHHQQEEKMKSLFHAMKQLIQEYESKSM